MLVIEQFITSLTVSLVHVLIAINLNLLNERRKKSISIKLFVVVFAIFFTVNTLIKNTYIRTPILLFIIPLCVFQLYKLNIVESLALTIIGDVVIFYGQYVSAIILNKYLENNLLISNNLMPTIIMSLLIFIFAAIVILIGNYIRKSPHAARRKMKSSIYYVIFLFIIIAFNYIFLYADSSAAVFYMLNFSLKVCLFLLFSSIMSFSEKVQFKQHLREKKQLIKYTSELESMYHDLSNEKHDFSNVLFSINGYIDDRNINELREYVNKIVGKDFCGNESTNYLTFLKHIKNPALKGIFFSKLSIATNKNIKLYINVFDEININTIASTDLVRIIGVLLDNAIEASEGSHDKEIYLSAEIENTHSSIVIANTYKKAPDVEKIFKRGYSTKGKNRGIGLYNLKKTLNLYPNTHLKTFMQDNVFFQELNIIE